MSLKQKISQLFSGSLIIRGLNSISLSLSRQAENGMIGYFLTSYRRNKRTAKPGMLGLIREKLDLGRRVIKPTKRALSREVQNSAIVNLITALFQNMLSYSLKFYAIFTFFFGSYALVISLLKYFALSRGSLISPDLITGAVLLLVSIPCMFMKDSVANVLLESRAASALLFGFLGMKKSSFRYDDAPKGKSNAAIISGMLIGVLTFFVPSYYIVAVFFLLIGLYGILVIPETGVVLIFFFLPFLPTMALGAFTVYVFFCYMIKLCRSKRTFKIQALDAVILVFAALILFGGVVSVSEESIKPSLMFICFIAGYFLTVNLIRSTSWIKRTLFALMSSSSIVALIGIYQKLTGNVSQTWQDSDMFSYIEGRIVSTFENPNVLAEYLIMTLPFMAALFITSKGGRKKTLPLILCAISSFALVYTWSRGAWIGIAFGLLLFFLIYSRQTISILLFSLVGIPFLPFVIPDSIFTRLASIGNLADSSTSYRMYIWRAAGGMIKDVFAYGIGIGEGAFKTVYPMYSFAGIESAPHSHNLYLQLCIELGILGLIVFFCAVVIFARSNFTMFALKPEREIKLFAAAGFCGIAAVLVQGLTDYVWYNYRVFFMFWLIMGLVSAMNRLAFSEKESEDGILCD